MAEVNTSKLEILNRTLGGWVQNRSQREPWLCLGTPCLNRASDMEWKMWAAAAIMLAAAYMDFYKRRKRT
jgi:hypothetical protein